MSTAITNKVLSLPDKAIPAFGASFHRPRMNPRDYGKSGTIASWLSPTGEQRSLPTNVRGLPARTNVNSLRSRRTPRFADPLPEGGKSYDSGVCIDNFVQERSDKSFLSGSAPTIVRCKKMYQTEYTERSNEALPQYREQITAEGLAARVPEHGQDYQNSRRVGYSSDYIQYARDGFARGPPPKLWTNCLCGDATIPDKQGAAWVGTAPCHMLQSLQQTTQAGLKPEFQKIHPSADGRMKAVITCSPDGQPQKSGNLQLTMARFGHSEKNHTKHWQSMYQTMICKAERL